jgi:hypothetical protein
MDKSFTLITISTFQFSMLILLFVIACNNKKKNSNDFDAKEIISDSNVSLKKEGEVRSISPSSNIGFTDIGNPIWGYRFVITGDFDGDHVIDTIKERFIDNKTGFETNKFFENLELLDYQVYDVKKRSVNAFLETILRNKKDTLSAIGKLGVSWLENIGDIDGNGTDEIGMVHYHPDMSSVNTFRIYTFNNGSWEFFYGFPIRDWELPALPESHTAYGLLGALEQVTIESDSLNNVIEESLKKYHHAKLLRKKVIELPAQLEDDCDEKYELAEEKTSGNLIWIKAVHEVQPDKIRSRLIQIDLEEYSESSRIKALEDLKKKEFEICDPGTTYLIKVTFK